MLELDNKFGKAFKRIRFGQIAARDPDGIMPEATKVGVLFPDWVSKRLKPQAVSKLPESQMGNLREIDRYRSSEVRKG